jgi:hypothetical protein
MLGPERRPRAGTKSEAGSTAGCGAGGSVGRRRRRCPKHGTVTAAAHSMIVVIAVIIAAALPPPRPPRLPVQSRSQRWCGQWAPSQEAPIQDAPGGGPPAAGLGSRDRDAGRRRPGCTRTGTFTRRC